MVVSSLRDVADEFRKEGILDSTSNLYYSQSHKPIPTSAIFVGSSTASATPVDRSLEALTTACPASQEKG